MPLPIRGGWSKEIYDILAPNNATVAVSRMNGSEKS
jgi:hypothetical protein